MIWKTATGSILALITLTTATYADGDAAAGEKVFRKCATCHQVGPDAQNRVGPILTGVIGREIASVEDFKYSDAFMEKKAEGLIWTDDNLKQYLAKPKDFIPGNKMTFAGLRKEDEIEDVLAYLASFQ